MRRTLAAAAALIATVAVLVAVDAAPAAAHPRRTTYTVTSTTPAGPTPHFPAFDPTTGHVLVSNVAANTVTDLEIGTGLGLPYDRQGPAGAHRTERMLGPWTRLARVPRILPALDGVEGKLDAGGVVADVGCGAGCRRRRTGATLPALAHPRL